MKQKILAVCLVLICVSIAATGTLTYYTAETTAHNVVTTGLVRLELKEIFPQEGVTDALPDNKIPKVVWVENTGTVPAWVRVSVRLEVTDRHGSPLPAALPDGTQLIGWTLMPGWLRDEEGFFCYERVLQPGESTANLMEKVTLSEKMGNEYKKSQIRLILNAYGVQSSHNGGSVLEAEGWPEKTA